jgi:hypothetical protein
VNRNRLYLRGYQDTYTRFRLPEPEQPAEPPPGKVPYWTVAAVTAAVAGALTLMELLLADINHQLAFIRLVLAQRGIGYG